VLYWEVTTCLSRTHPHLHLRNQADELCAQRREEAVVRTTDSYSGTNQAVWSNIWASLNTVKSNTLLERKDLPVHPNGGEGEQLGGVAPALLGGAKKLRSQSVGQEKGRKEDEASRGASSAAGVERGGCQGIPDLVIPRARSEIVQIRDFFVSQLSKYLCNLNRTIRQ
jgi:hypothetical protein